MGFIRSMYISQRRLRLEAVYGSELTLPGQFLEVQDPPNNLFYENLKNSMSGF